MNEKWVLHVREGPAAAAAEEFLRVLNEVDAPDENAMSDLIKTRRQAERAIWILKNCDPYLMPQTALDEAQQSLTIAIDFAQQYQTTQDLTMLTNTMANAEATLRHLATAAIPGESASPAEQLAGFSRSLSEQEGMLRRDMTALVDSLQTQVTNLDQQRQIVEQQNAELFTRAEQLRTELDALRQDSTTLTTQWQSSFTEEQSSRSDQFRTLLEDQRVQGSGVLSTLSTKTNDTIETAEQRIKEALNAILENQEKVENLVGIINDEALIGEPSRRANEDKRYAFWWSLGAVALGLVATGIAVIAIVVHSSSDRDWIGFALKTFAALAVGGVGAYAARQASEHRGAQRELAHLAVQLAAVKPFLRDISPTVRDQVLQGVAAKLFVPRSSGTIGDDEVVLPPGTMQLVQLLFNAARVIK